MWVRRMVAGSATHWLPGLAGSITGCGVRAASPAASGSAGQQQQQDRDPGAHGYSPSPIWM